MFNEAADAIWIGANDWQARVAARMSTNQMCNRFIVSFSFWMGYLLAVNLPLIVKVKLSLRDRVVLFTSSFP
jgi:hypothetical protein